MIWLLYVVCAVVILLAVVILVKEIHKMIKGRCCENCKHCEVKEQCTAKDSTHKKV